MSLIFVDTEAAGPCPATGLLTEFGAVDYWSRDSFHGRLWMTHPHPRNAAIPVIDGPADSGETVFKNFYIWLRKFNPPYIFISDNPAYDWQWINDGFWRFIGDNPFGHSARRIGDFYAGSCDNFFVKQKWKSWRETPHDHNPVNDALGNAQAFQHLIESMKARRETRP
jgi:hypothetical protein